MANSTNATTNDFFGHPRGLSTLFFTELWERFSYYGMRALLVLFMTAEAIGDNPGLGFGVGEAAAIYGIYTFFVYVLSLPGGWIADNIWGQKKAVFVGGCIIAAGHFSMAVPTTLFFFIGLVLIVIGTGLLKPNVSSMVGDLYPEGGARRDAGFSIFYMGINFGAILGPLLCGILGEGYNWHYGFSLAGFGMLLGLVSYKIGDKYLVGSGELAESITPKEIQTKSKMFYGIASLTVAFVVAFGFLVSSGAIFITLKGLAEILGVLVVLIVIVFFAVLINNKKWILPIVLVSVASFFVVDMFTDDGGFRQAAVVEFSNDLSQSLEKGKIDAAAYESVAGETDLDFTNLSGDQAAEITEKLTEAQVLALLDQPDGSVESLANELSASMNLQFTAGIVLLLFILVSIGQITVPTISLKIEQKRLMVIFWLFILAALFWSGFEQAGSSLNLFASELTDRSTGPNEFLGGMGAIILTLIIALPLGYYSFRTLKREDLWSMAKGAVVFSSVGILVFFYWLFNNIGDGWIIPASTLQLINPTFIVIFAPIFGVLWTWLASRDANPSIPVKFGLGLLGLAAGFFVLSWGSANASADNLVSPAWLIVTYFLHTVGELCLSPVGLSSMTKLAPKNRVSQMMGIWFVATALGNLIAGLVAGQLESLAPSGLFQTVALIIGGGGIVALLASPGVKKLMGDVE